MKKSAGLSRNENLVLGALRRGRAPQSAYQLLDALRDEGIKAPPQVYRALKSLSGRHLVHRLESLNAFVACSHDHSHEGRSLIFAICESCGKVGEYCDRAVEERLAALSAAKGFAENLSVVEIRGRCAECRGAAPAKG